MNLTALPTLQKIVLLKLAVRVCGATEIKSFIENYETSPWSENRNRAINEAISYLGLPKSLHEKLVSLMRPVIIEISSWILYIHNVHYEVVNCSRISCSCLTEIDLQENLHWQTIGLLDKHTTTLYLIKDVRLDTAFRFVLACGCCSEDDILFLWRRLSSNVHQRIKKFIFLPIVKYWTSRLEEAPNPHCNYIPNSPFPCPFVFEYSHRYLTAMYSFYRKLPYDVQNYLFGTYGISFDDLKRKVLDEIDSDEFKNRVTVGLVNVDNVAALRYFLQKFERIKRRKLLEVVARNHFISNELLVFCLSQMTRDQVRELLRSGRGGRILSCLANSPWQESFWDFINDNWDDLTKADFIEFLTYIVNFKVKGKWKDFDYIPYSRELCIRCLQK